MVHKHSTTKIIVSWRNILLKLESVKDAFAITARVSCYRDPNVPEEMQEEDGLLYEYHVYERLHDV
jgi:hypothetical protein